MTYNDIDSKELQEMKQQYALLKRKLEKEVIVNERMIRRSMQTKANTLRRNAIIECAVCIALIPVYLWVIPQLMGVTLGSFVLASVLMVIAVIYNYYMHRHFDPAKFTTSSLLEMQKETIRFKKTYANWLKFFGLPFIIIFIVWFYYDAEKLFQGELLRGILVGGAIGAIIGGIIGLIIRQKTLQNTDEILQHIEDLEQE